MTQLNFLKTLILWSLTTSDVISTTIKDSYKQSRHEDDLNQPLSVQPWGVDGDKRRYWLVEGQDDTSFRVYREGNRALKNIPWWSVAGTIDECKVVAEKLEKENTQASRRLATRIRAAIPRFEATDEVRKKHGQDCDKFLTSNRSVGVASTAKSAAHNLPVQSSASLSTKAVPVASACATRTRTEKTTTRMPHQPDDPLVILATRPLQTMDLSLLPADVK